MQQLHVEKNSKVLAQMKEVCSRSMTQGHHHRAMASVRFLDSRSAFQYYACKFSTA
jgi:hypothetical protein